MLYPSVMLVDDDAALVEVSSFSRLTWQTSFSSNLWTFSVDHRRALSPPVLMSASSNHAPGLLGRSWRGEPEDLARLA
jgi:hypothetical protein